MDSLLIAEIGGNRVVPVPSVIQAASRIALPMSLCRSGRRHSMRVLCATSAFWVRPQMIECK
jgi:hypothetical protein